MPDFYFRSPGGGGQRELVAFRGVGDVSMHALREEGDLVRYYGVPTEKVFLSTPSVRRATRRLLIC